MGAAMFVQIWNLMGDLRNVTTIKIQKPLPSAHWVTRNYAWHDLEKRLFCPCALNTTHD